MIRKPTVDEWFLALQLKQIKKGFHLPFHLKADVTHMTLHSSRPLFTAMLVKAASILLRQRSQMNKIITHGTCGIRIIEPAYNGVNVPLELEIEGRKIVTGVTIEDAFRKSLKEIHDEIKKAKGKTLNDLPVNKIIHSRGLDFIKKIKLKILHFILMNFPSLYLKKRVGGISVSSLLNYADPSVNVSMSAFGMTVLTISSCSIIQEKNKTYLDIGMAFDHSVIHGKDGVEAIHEFVRILQNPELFSEHV